MNTGNRDLIMYDAQKKSTGLAFILWLLLGQLGAHRFYLGRWKTGLLLPVLVVFGWVQVFAMFGKDREIFPGAGFIILAAVGLWLLVDAFRISGMVRIFNVAIAQKVSGA